MLNRSIQYAVLTWLCVSIAYLAPTAHASAPQLPPTRCQVASDCMHNARCFDPIRHTHLLGNHQRCSNDGPNGCYCTPQTKQRYVLVVVDMQNDYDQASNSSTLSPWAVDLTAYKKRITDLYRDFYATNRSWSLIVWTRDTPRDGFCDTNTGRCSLKNGSFGARSVFEGTVMLQSPPRPVTPNAATPNMLFWSKTTDNWMLQEINDWGLTRHSWGPTRYPEITTKHQPICDENSPYSETCSDLHAWLIRHGYTPSITTLVVVGVASNRCVMKGAVNAQALGYQVVVIKNAIAGPAQPTQSDKWFVCSSIHAMRNDCLDGIDCCNAPPTKCKSTSGSPCDAEAFTAWRTSIYQGAKGGPSRKQAFEIMQHAGVQIFDRVDEFLKSLQKTRP